MEPRSKPKLTTYNSVDRIKEEKEAERSVRKRPEKARFASDLPKRSKQPDPLLEKLLEEAKPPRLLKRRFEAQGRQKEPEGNRPQNRAPLLPEEPEPEDSRLPPVRGPPPEDPCPGPSHAYHPNLDKNFVRMLKEKQTRAQVDAENVEMIDLKLRRKKQEDMENVIKEKKMLFKCADGQRWQEEVKRQKSLRTCSLATFWAEQKEVDGLIKGRGFGKLKREEWDGVELRKNKEAPPTAERAAYEQLAALKMRKAASLAMLEEKQIKETVAARREAEEAHRRDEERRRQAAVEEFMEYNRKAIREKEQRRREKREQEREEALRQVEVVNQKGDIEKRLLTAHYRGAQEIQDDYAKVIDEDFLYEHSKTRILCNVPITRDDGPREQTEWPYLTSQGNYMETLTGARLYHKGQPLPCSRPFPRQQLCFTSEGFEF